MPKARPGGLAELLLAGALLLTAFSLRPVFSSLSAVLPQAMSDLALSPFYAGLITTLPVLCLGLFAPFAPRLARRFGLERTVVGVLALVAAGAAPRPRPGSGATPSPGR